jgi:hypothetical protein
MKLGKNESFKSQMKFAFKLEMCLDTSHKSSYVFWSGLIFLFFYITHNDYSFILIMRMIHDTINQKIRHLITHRLIWVIYYIECRKND